MMFVSMEEFSCVLEYVMVLRGGGVRRNKQTETSSRVARSAQIMILSDCQISCLVAVWWSCTE